MDRNKTDLDTETLEEQNTKTIKSGNVKSTASETGNKNLTNEIMSKIYQNYVIKSAP